MDSRFCMTCLQWVGFFTLFSFLSGGRMATAQTVNAQDITRLDQVKVSQYFGCNTFN
jgi:hypothetical protein